MGSVKVKMNAAGCAAVLNSAGVQSRLLSEADGMLSRAEAIGSGSYAADVQPGKKRAHAMVKTMDARAAASNAKHNVLLKAMGGS